jgi:5-methylcytosine-specific restriction endonuclease McrA
MTNTLPALASLNDSDLLLEVKRLAAAERHATAALIASLAEVDARRLYLGEGCSSLFTYCTQVLHLSEHTAYGRIEAARAARRFSVILDLLAEGSVNLTAVSLLAPHLTLENHRDVLVAARHKTKRDVEQLVARLRPLPAVPSSVRKLAGPKPTAVSTAALADDRSTDDPPIPLAAAASPHRPTVVLPLAPERYKVQFTISAETHENLRRVQDLLRHSIPDGDPAKIFDRALTLLLEDLERTKLAVTRQPRRARATADRSRHIPAAVRREVWSRDGGRCAFVGTTGRCVERGRLEFHHVMPHADGGPATVENIQLRCRAHNAYEAEQWFGPLLTEA